MPADDEAREIARRLTCKTCRWWDRTEPHHTHGDCRRLPPLNTLAAYGRAIGGDRVQVTMESHRAASWPNTSGDDWCGEHSRVRAALVEMEARGDGA